MNSVQALLYLQGILSSLTLSLYLMIVVCGAVMFVLYPIIMYPGSSEEKTRANRMFNIFLPFLFSSIVLAVLIPNHEAVQKMIQESQAARVCSK